MDLDAIIKSVGTAVTFDILTSVIVFPRTSSLKNDTPRVIWKMGEDVKSYEDAMAKATAHPELIAINAAEDTKLVLHALDLVQKELHLDQFDSIQIYRGGIDILRITNNVSHSADRSAYIEINEFRRRLIQSQVHKWYNNPYALIGVSSVLSSATTIAMAVGAYRLLRVVKKV